MQRSQAIEHLNAREVWDVVVIGGGATGLGVALDAATRGFSTLLLEAHDFAKGTSSRSTKLVHGGVRYLAQGYVDLVREALRERGRLARNAPHLFKTQAFIIPGEKWWTAPYYSLGLWMYDRLAGSLGIGRTRHLSQEEARRRLAGVKEEKLRAGVCYFDGQFDDARLALCLAQSVVDHGGTVLNHSPVTGLLKDAQGAIEGVRFTDESSGKQYEIKAKSVFNATGVFTNPVTAMDEPHTQPPIIPSQGIHLVLDRDFLPGEDALMVPKTSDGRVLFAVPWHDKLVVGTTDTLIKDVSLEPKPLEDEIAFILATAKEYLKRAPTRADVRSVFVGLRPLAAPKDKGQSTKEVSRSHKVEVSQSGLVNIVGGKWTTYRQMAEDALDAAVGRGLLPAKPCKTQDLRLHGYIDAEHHLDDTPLALYGSDATRIEQLAKDDPALNERLHPGFPYIYAQVQWAIGHEMAESLEDVLARRLRLLFLDAQAAETVAPDVARFMGERLGWSEARIDAEVQNFQQLARQYQLPA
ncbi:MAG: glycerol-3-phosphate dehydrogenase/oxidase [Lautropia sp.]|nr:glycerol-3-phosphate dehydrogenase/oxidase [Lautropia sp.]